MQARTQTRSDRPPDAAPDRAPGVRRRADRPGRRRRQLVRAGTPTGLPAPAGRSPAAGAFGLPNLRRNVCPHFYMTGSRGRDPDPGAAPAQGAHPPGRERLALPAPRRRPPRAGLRQRRLPDPALQPVRLLRGRADPGVTVAEATRRRPTTEAPPRPSPGARPVRHPARARAGPGRSCASSATRSSAVRGALVGGTNGKGSVLALAGSRAARPPAYRVGETPKPHLVSTASGSRSTAGRSTPATFARLVGEVAAGRRPGRPPARRADRVRAPHRRRLPLVRRGSASTSPSSRSGWAAGSTRPMPGTAAWPRSRTSTSTTWTGSARRSPHIAREKAAIIERGDLAVTGATGEALAVIRRRARRLGVAADRGRRRRRSSAGTATGSTSTCRGSGETRVGLRGRHQAANVGGRRRGPRCAGGGRDRHGRDGGPPARLRDGPLARPARAHRCDVRTVRARCSSTAPTTRPAPRPSPAPSTTSGRPPRRRRGRAAADHAGHRRRWRTRTSPGSSPRWPRRRSPRRGPGHLHRRSTCRGRCRRPTSPSGWAAGRAGRTGREVVDADVGRGARPGARRGGRGPVVVAGSLYLVGAVRARLVDDPPCATRGDAAPMTR